MEFHTKEQIITEYLGKIDFSKDDWSYKKMQTDLSKLIGEAPAIDFNYTKTVVLNEFNSEAKEVNIIESVDVIYSPNLDDKFKKLSLKIGRVDS